MTHNSSQSPSTFNILTFYITLKSFSSVNSNIKQAKCKIGSSWTGLCQQLSLQSFQLWLMKVFSINPVPSLPCKNEYLTIVLKNYAKADFKILCSCLIFRAFLKIFCQILCPRLWLYVNFFQKSFFLSVFLKA